MLQLNSIEIQYDKPLFLPLSFSLSKGELLVIKGASGCGKSSLLNAMAGLIPFTGSVNYQNSRYNQSTVHVLRKHIAYLTQNIYFPYDRVDDYFTAIFSLKANALDAPSLARIHFVLESFGLEASIMKKSVHEVSGGQLQRVALAVCLLMKKDIILLDEPTSGLDADSALNVATIISEIADSYVVCVSHDDAILKKSKRVVEVTRIL